MALLLHTNREGAVLIWELKRRLVSSQGGFEAADLLAYNAPCFGSCLASIERHIPCDCAEKAAWEAASIGRSLPFSTGLSMFSTFFKVPAAGNDRGTIPSAPGKEEKRQVPGPDGCRSPHTAKTQELEGQGKQPNTYSLKKSS